MLIILENDYIVNLQKNKNQTLHLSLIVFLYLNSDCIVSDDALDAIPMETLEL